MAVAASGRQHVARARAFGLSPPCIALSLNHFDTGMQMASVYRGLQEQILRLGQLLAQLGVLGGQGEEYGRHVIAHACLGAVAEHGV